MSYPLVSVIIPVYNVENYLKECLDSVLNQTYKNIEVIVINDGSTDKSLHILEDYSSKFNNIKIIDQENSGQSVARNKGLENAKGKYIYFLDSDDYILPDTLKKLIKKLEMNNLDIIRFAARPFSENINKRIDVLEYDFKDYFEEKRVYNKQDFLTRNLKAFSPSPVLYVVKKEVITKNKLLFYPRVIHEDELFTLELFLNINRMMYDSTPYYQRRYRQNSTMTSHSNSKKSFDAYFIVLKETIKLLEQYKGKYEKKLINDRIYKLTGRLIYNEEVTMNYKIEKLKELGILFDSQTLFFFVKRNIRKLFNR